MTKLMSIDDAVKRSLPLVDHATARALIAANPGFFAAHRHSPDDELHWGDDATEIRIGHYADDPAKGLNRYAFVPATSHNLVLARVDLRDYLDTYAGLLDNPASVRQYADLVHPAVMLALKKSDGWAWPVRNHGMDLDKMLIRALFGPSGNSLFKWTTTNPHAAASYVRDRVLPLYAGRFPADDDGRIPHWRLLNGTDTSSHNACPRLALAGIRDSVESAPVSVYYAYDFSIPSKYPDADKFCFDGFRKTAELLMACPYMAELSWCPGNQVSMVPTYRRAVK